MLKRVSSQIHFSKSRPFISIIIYINLNLYSLLPEVKKILFVCVENAARSQMAEAFFKKYAPPGFEPCSAGTRPASKVNPVAAEVMTEIGIDISAKKPQIISNQLIKEAFKIINMGCMDKQTCPALFVNDVEDWQIPDPKEKPIHQVRKIRDLIEGRIRELCKSLQL